MKRRGLYDVTNQERSRAGPVSLNTDNQLERPCSSMNIKRKERMKPKKKIMKKDFYFLSEYSKEIFMHLLLREVQLGGQLANSNGQCQSHRRADMIMWFISVANKSHISNDCLHLAIALFDRYCSQASQVDLYLGIITLWIASKVEDSFPVSLKEILKQSDFPSGPEIRHHCLRLEVSVLQVLDFNVNIPTPIQFLRHFTKVSKTNEVCHQISKFIIDLSLIDPKFMGLPYSLIAASSFCVACDLMKHVPEMGDSWNRTLQMYSSLEKMHLLPIMKDMAIMLVGTSKILKSMIPLYRRYSKTVESRHLSKENMRNYQYKMPLCLI